MANIKSFTQDHPGCVTPVLKTLQQKRAYKDAHLSTRTVASTFHPRDVTVPIPNEFMVGPFRVTMQYKQHYRLYNIRLPSTGEVIGKQASYPSIHDCLASLDKARGSGQCSGQEANQLIKLASKAL